MSPVTLASRGPGMQMTGAYFVYVTRHDILCPNDVKRDVSKTCHNSDVIYTTVLCCATWTSPLLTNRNLFKLSWHKL